MASLAFLARLADNISRPGIAISTMPKDFINDGFGWSCRHCLIELGPAIADAAADSPPRLLLEGENEGKSPQMANPARARWADAARRILCCPRCGITELIDVG